MALEFKSSAVMAYILYKCKLANHKINKTQSQKLLYCCYGIIMAKFDERLTDEHPRCWPYGPVFPRTFTAIQKGELTVEVAQKFLKNCPAQILDYIDKTIRTFWNYSATQLSKWTKLKDSPWDKAEALGPLDDREIRLFFTGYIAIINERGKA